MRTVKHLESLCCLGRPLNGAMIALAMLTNLAAGALGGILIPQLLHRFLIDQAVFSGALVATVVISGDRDGVGWVGVKNEYT